MELLGTRSALAAMCAKALAQLRPGGRFVGSVPDSRYDRHRAYDTRYGVTYHWPHDMHDGDGFTLHFHLMDPPLSLDCFYWRNETYQVALEEAGFRHVRWHPWLPDRAGVDTFGQEFWAPWTANPMTAVLSCVKPAEDPP